VWQNGDSIGEEMRAYISNQVKMHAYHLNFWDTGQWFLQISLEKNSKRNPSSGRPTWNGEHWNCFWKIFIFENFSTWADCLWELDHLKNHCIFPPPFIFHSWGSAFPILPPLECAFEPSPHFFSSAPSSHRPSKGVCFLPYLLLSAPSSPHLISFRVCFRALDH
jgi:hypothetical protein